MCEYSLPCDVYTKITAMGVIDFVAHDPIAESIVVAHQGTDPDNM